MIDRSKSVSWRRVVEQIPTCARLLEVADISGNRGDLLFGQLLGDRAHDVRIVRVLRVLPTLLGPVRQLGDHVAVELAGQARKLVNAVGVLAVARLAGRNLRAGNAFMVDLFPFGHEVSRSAAIGRRVEILEMCGQSVDHRGAEDMGHITHHGVQPPAIDEGLQLVLYIVRQLARESGHGIRPYEAARRQPMTSFTIARLGFKFLRWNAFGLRRAASLAVFGVGPGAEDNGEQRSRRESLDNLHDLPPQNFRAAIVRSALPARRDRTTRPIANGTSVYRGAMNWRRISPLPDTPNVVARVWASFDCAAGTFLLSPRPGSLPSRTRPNRPRKSILRFDNFPGAIRKAQAFLSSK